MIPTLDLGMVQIPTYFLVISLSVSLLLFFLSYRVKYFEYPRKIAFDIAIILMIGGFIGGRLLHVFYEEFDYYMQDPKKILFFWNGGFVFFGGFILAWSSAWVYCRIKKINFLMWADFFAPILSLSHALGRIGCILSGCCFGTYCSLPWSMDGRHPTASYLAAGEFLIFLVLMLFEKNILLLTDKRSKYNLPGIIFFLWVFMHSLLRFVVEFYRDDFRGVFLRIPGVSGIPALSISQAICLVLMVFSIWFLAPKLLRKK
ncbi:MAG: prolipoprotein diacylglyceryl transferase family protein [Pseudobdellovibrio sp.]